MSTRELTVGRKTREAISKSLRTSQREALTAAAFLCRARHGRKSQEPTCASCLAAITRDVEGLIPNALYASPLPEIRAEDVERGAIALCWASASYNGTPDTTDWPFGSEDAKRDYRRKARAVLEAVSARKGAAPPRERVPGVRPEDVMAIRARYQTRLAQENWDDAEMFSRILAAVEYCAARSASRPPESTEGA